jgi:hypothetical protein
MIRYTNIPLENYDESFAVFHVYFKEQFTGKVANLSPKLLKKILQKIYELFSNVFRHSESALGLFCSGQFYPKSEQFKFTIADNGTTIKTKVNRYLSISLKRIYKKPIYCRSKFLVKNLNPSMVLKLSNGLLRINIL